jgi:hypothetical protein
MYNRHPQHLYVLLCVADPDQNPKSDPADQHLLRVRYPDQLVTDINPDPVPDQ